MCGRKGTGVGVESSGGREQRAHPLLSGPGLITRAHILYKLRPSPATGDGALLSSVPHKQFSNLPLLKQKTVNMPYCIFYLNKKNSSRCCLLLGAGDWGGSEVNGSTGGSRARLWRPARCFWAAESEEEGECVCPFSVGVGAPHSAPTPPGGCQGSLQRPQGSLMLPDGGGG